MLYIAWETNRQTDTEREGKIAIFSIGRWWCQKHHNFNSRKFDPQLNGMWMKKKETIEIALNETSVQRSTIPSEHFFENRVFSSRCSKKHWENAFKIWFVSVQCAGCLRLIIEWFRLLLLVIEPWMILICKLDTPLFAFSMRLHQK